MEKKYKCGILLFEQFHGKKDIGSSRIRGHWLVKYWKNAEIFKMGQKYDVVIYQKAYFVEHARAFKGLKILDICDADFLHFGYRTKETINECDVITTSTEELKKAIQSFTDKPVVFIPDRMDLEFHREKKVHKGLAQSVVWFGYSQNFPLLDTTIPFLYRNNLKLIVISDRDYVPPVGFERLSLENIRWRLKTVNRNIIKGDIVINPRSSKSKWKYKSNNKTITSYLLNMPVAESPEDLKRFLKPEERIKEVEIKRKWAIENFDVRISVKEYHNLICKLLKNEKI